MSTTPSSAPSVHVTRTGKVLVDGAHVGWVDRCSAGGRRSRTWRWVEGGFTRGGYRTRGDAVDACVRAMRPGLLPERVK